MCHTKRLDCFPSRHRASTRASTGSAWGSQQAISIARHSSIAVVGCACLLVLTNGDVQQAQPVMTVDDERAHGAFLGPGGTPQRRSVSPAQSPAGTVEHHALLYGLLGCLQASSQGGCAPAGHMQHVEDPT